MAFCVSSAGGVLLTATSSAFAKTLNCSFVVSCFSCKIGKVVENSSPEEAGVFSAFCDVFRNLRAEDYIDQYKELFFHTLPFLLSFIPCRSLIFIRNQWYRQANRRFHGLFTIAFTVSSSATGTSK